MFVADTDRDPIHLGLDRKLGGLAMEVLGDPVKKLAQLLLAVRVVQTLHGHGVKDRAEGVERRPADFFRGRVFVHQAWMGFFKIQKLPVKPVIGGVGNLRPGLHVIKAVVAPDLLQQFGVALGGGGAHLWKRRLRPRPTEIPMMSAIQSGTQTSRPGASRCTCSSMAPIQEPIIPSHGEG